MSFLPHIGDNLICSNQRGITLLSIPGKLIALILSQSSIHAVRSKRRVQQVSVVPGHSTFSAARLPKKVNAFRHSLFLSILQLLSVALIAIVTGRFFRTCICLKSYADCTRCFYQHTELCLPRKCFIGSSLHWLRYTPRLCLVYELFNLTVNRSCCRCRPRHLCCYRLNSESNATID